MSWQDVTWPLRMAERTKSPLRRSSIRSTVGGAPSALDQADAADGGRRQDRLAIGLVVERDIAGDDREIERRQASPMPSMAHDELAHDFRAFRIAEIEVVGGRQRFARQWRSGCASIRRRPACRPRTGRPRHSAA
jgi:hypothetical protein